MIIQLINIRDAKATPGTDLEGLDQRWCGTAHRDKCLACQVQSRLNRTISIEACKRAPKRFYVAFSTKSPVACHGVLSVTGERRCGLMDLAL